MLIEENAMGFRSKLSRQKVSNPVVCGRDLLNNRVKLIGDHQQQVLTQEPGHLGIFGLLADTDLNNCSVVAEDLNSLP